ncbi:MAG: S4 domain-containing protein [Lactococcus garvieae]
MINDIRVQKYISQAGVASRREAEKLIIEKKVKINGKIAELGRAARCRHEVVFVLSLRRNSGDKNNITMSNMCISSYNLY